MKFACWNCKVSAASKPAAAAVVDNKCGMKSIERNIRIEEHVLYFVLTFIFCFKSDKTYSFKPQRFILRWLLHSIHHLHDQIKFIYKYIFVTASVRIPIGRIFIFLFLFANQFYVLALRSIRLCKRTEFMSRSCNFVFITVDFDKIKTLQ